MKTKNILWKDSQKKKGECWLCLHPRNPQWDLCIMYVSPLPDLHISLERRSNHLGSKFLVLYIFKTLFCTHLPLSLLLLSPLSSSLPWAASIALWAAWERVLSSMSVTWQGLWTRMDSLWCFSKVCNENIENPHLTFLPPSSQRTLTMSWVNVALKCVKGSLGSGVVLSS